jgi:hypothetical protein
MNRKTALLAVLAISIAIGALACTSANDPIKPSGTPPVLDIKFSTGVIPALNGQSDVQLSCAGGGCHSSSAPQGGLSLGPISGTFTAAQLYTQLTSTPGLDGVVVVNTGSPALSELLTKPDSGSPGVTHTGGKLWDSNKIAYKTVLGWIVSGSGGLPQQN